MSGRLHVELLAVVTGQAAGGSSLLYAVAFSLGTVLGVYALWNGSTNVWQGYRIWAAEPTPARRARQVDGDVEVTGRAEVLAESLDGTYSNLPCLVQEWEKRRDASGAGGDAGADERPMDEGRDGVPFLVRDDSGTIPVDPAGATLSLETDRSNTSHDIRQTEARLEPGDEVYVFGRVRRTSGPREDLGDETVYIGAGEDANGFRITDTEPDETILRLVGTGLVYLLAGVLVTGAFGVGTMAALGF